MARASKLPSSHSVPTFQKFIYGLGALTNNLLSGAIGSMSIVLNLGLGMNPATIGWIQGSSRLVDAFLDPIMGYTSDHTKSHWGRRRPYIVIGALACAFVFAAMWQVHAGYSQQFYFWFFLIGTNLFYIALTIYAAPFIALGYEMTEDYHERTRIQAYSNVLGQVPWLLLSWSYAFMENKRLFDTPVEGARTLAIWIGITVAGFGVLPGIFCKEPLYAVAQSAPSRRLKKARSLMSGLRHHLSEFIRGFGITMKNTRFLRLAAATFLVFNGFNIIAGLGSYVIIFYVFAGNHALGAKYVGWSGTALSVCTFFAIGTVSLLSDNFGKKRAFIISMAIAMAGYVLKWFCYQPGSPGWLFLPAPFIAFGLGGLFTTVSAMIADVCDMDELEVGYRREGTFGAIYWWMVKLGIAAALALSGHLLNFTGFLQELGAHQSAHSLLLMRIFEIGLPLFTYGLAIAVMLSYDLDQSKVQAIQVELKKRHAAL